MKLSIWQQFASNHSNGFTIVGEFASESEAQKAAKRLESMLQEIYLQSIGYFVEEPVQAELDIGKEFDIEWTQHLDWIYVNEYDHVLQFDQYVAISDHHTNTWQGSLYISQVMSKLASKVFGTGRRDINVIGVELSCVAPTTDVANSINAELNPYFEDVRAERVEVNSAPWKQFYPQLKDTFMMSTAAYYGYIHQKDTRITFDHLKFGTIGTGLPALIAYLKDKGCTEIKYTIKDVPMDELFEE